MFNPCEKCSGYDRSGWGNHECRDCKITELENEVSCLEFKIRNELEPRIAREKIAYDNYITNQESVRPC